jgi:hypothetical protein
MKKLLALFLVAGVLAACSKDKFNTVPTVEITSFGPEEVYNQNFFNLVATVTDKEGDLQDSVTIYRNLYRGTIVVTDSIRVSLKGLGSPVKDKIELQVTFRYGSIEPQGRVIPQNLEYNADREMSVGLIVRDNAGNRSNYVESNKILLKKYQ